MHEYNTDVRSTVLQVALSKNKLKHTQLNTTFWDENKWKLLS